MVLKDTINSMKKFLEEISHDLQKSLGGNKAASQRVRTGTIKLERTAKLYRKESVASEKKSGIKGAKKTVDKKGGIKKVPSKTSLKRK